MGELAEYWKDVKPILKQQNEEHREIPEHEGRA